MKFKVGDKVRVIPDESCDNCRDKILTITRIGNSDSYPIITDADGEIFSGNELVFVKGTGKRPIENPVRYISIITSCNNLSEVYDTEKEMISNMKAQDGEVIGYKLIPIKKKVNKVVIKNLVKKKAKKRKK